MIIYECLFLCDNVLHSFPIKTITRPFVPLCGVAKQTGAGSASRPRGRTVFTVGTERYSKIPAVVRLNNNKLFIELCCACAFL